MSEKNHLPSKPVSASVPEMLDDYRRRRDALQAQRRELAELQREVLDAVAREGAAIVANTRASIARILADARRDLLTVSKRLESVQDSEGQRLSLHLARREITRVLDEAKPAIEALGADALPHDTSAPQHEPPAQFHAREERRSPFPERHLEPALPERGADPVWLEARPEPAPTRPAHGPMSGVDVRVWPVRRSPQVMIIGVIVVAVAILASVLWWISRPAARVQSTQPPAVGSAPPQPLAQRGGSPLPTRSLPARPAHPLTLVVQARRAVWIRSTIDGRADGGRVVAAGQRSEIAADRDVSIRAGDGGAVVVSVNGSKFEPLGVDGAVVTKRFTADRQPAPAPPARGSVPNESAVTLPATPPRATPDAAPPPSPSAPAPRESQSAPQPPAATSRDSSASSAELSTAVQQWLDAYFRRDTAAMQSVATKDMKVSDQRSATERLPASAENVRRALDGVSFQFVGETAIMTGRMSEQGFASGRAVQSISWVSLMWIRESGQWRLMDVQLLSDAKLRGR